MKTWSWFLSFLGEGRPSEIARKEPRVVFSSRTYLPVTECSFGDTCSRPKIRYDDVYATIFGQEPGRLVCRIVIRNTSESGDARGGTVIGIVTSRRGSICIKSFQGRHPSFSVNLVFPGCWIRLFQVAGCATKQNNDDNDLKKVETLAVPELARAKLGAPPLRPLPSPACLIELYICLKLCRDKKYAYWLWCRSG